MPKTSAKKKKPAYIPSISKEDIELIVRARHWDPFSALGMHEVKVKGRKRVAVRVMAPGSVGVTVLEQKQDPGGDSENDTRRYPMTLVHHEGLYELLLPARKTFFSYTLEIDDTTGNRRVIKDPYTFLPTLTDYELHLFGEGSFHKLSEKFGAYLEHEGEKGVLFAVWAPNAESVSVVGEMNWWDARVHQLRNRGTTGVWELFIPDIPPGTQYKFRIVSKTDGSELYKADPFARFSQVRPRTASVTFDTEAYRWEDEEWMTHRESKNSFSAPVSIYEVHLGSWMRPEEHKSGWMSYRELADKLTAHVKETGFTHVELLPILEHPFDGSWGYQVTGFHSPTSRFGTPHDFQYLVDTLHRNGIGVILDWVPAHFPDDFHGLGLFDGTHLYEHEDPRLGVHRDWDTLIFNFGRREVSNFLISNALYWLKFFHLDGLRVDAVASMLYLDYSRKEGEWLPNKYGGRENLEAIDFIKRFNEIIYGSFPGVMTIAEESTAWPGVSHPVYAGGLGFGMKWNMGWMHDMLNYMSKDPIHRKFHHSNLTFSLLYAFNENFILPLSHDEVVHGKGSLLGRMPGDEWQRFANLRLLYTYMFAHPGKKLIFMGGEIGQYAEWDHDSELDWGLLAYKPHNSLKRFLRDLNLVYRAEPSMYEVDNSFEGFRWIDFRDSETGIVAFIRYAKDSTDHTVFIFNFTPLARHDYRIGMPSGRLYKVLVNSDKDVYFGSGAGSMETIRTDPVPWHGFDHSAKPFIPPLGALILKPE